LEISVLKRKKFYIQNLADELIELRCGDHSTGNIYEWLLKAYGARIGAPAGKL